jgi:hypothetical protein
MDATMPDKPASSSRLGSYSWLLVLCLVGLDYFSTLAYLPSIAFAAAGKLAPLAALGVVAITLLLAVPVYCYVVRRSPHGHGATGLLEERTHGWFGKMLILVLLGFVATDFVITRTLSLADASVHILHNPHWQERFERLDWDPAPVRDMLPGWLHGPINAIWKPQVVLTIALSIVCFFFWMFLYQGFTRTFLRLAVLVVGLYLALTSIIVGSGVLYLFNNRELLQDWTTRLTANLQDEIGRGGNTMMALLALALLPFPQMALGLSGFELSMASAPLVKGHATDEAEQPRGRIRNTQKLIIASALIMAVFVVGSVLVVTLLVPHRSLEAGGRGTDRALAYLAHGEPLSDQGGSLGTIFGPTFGTLYDVSTVLILCLAGASAAIGFRDMLPYYLARYGMQPRWAARVNVIIHLFNVIILVVILYFRASVADQQWAYATSVLVLLTSASFAASLDLRHRWRGSWLRPLVELPFLLIGFFFLTMAALTLSGGASGLVIALLFVLTLLVTAFVSRWMRATELRFQGFAFGDEVSKKRWEEICQLEFQVLVPHDPTGGTLAFKELEVRRRHRLTAEVPIIFIEVELGDPSEFYHQPLMHIHKEDGREIIRVSSCSSIPHVIAAIGLEFRHVGQPPEIHFAWSDESPLTASLGFLFMGRGNVPWLVHELIRKAEQNPSRRPRVVIG